MTSSRSKSPQPTLSTPRHPPKERPGPVGGKRDRNRRLRTKALCQAALELFLEFGIRSVTIDQIAKRAQFAKGNFYRYFKNKAELVESIFRPVNEGFDVAFKSSLENMARVKDAAELIGIYQQLGMGLFQVISGHPKIVLLYLQESRAPATGANKALGQIAKRIKDSSLELTHIAHSHGLLKAMNPNLTTLTVIGATESLLYDLLKGEDVGNPIEVLNDLVSMILHGLLKPQ